MWFTLNVIVTLRIEMMVSVNNAIKCFIIFYQKGLGSVQELDHMLFFSYNIPGCFHSSLYFDVSSTFIEGNASAYYVVAVFRRVRDSKKTRI